MRPFKSSSMLLKSTDSNFSIRVLQVVAFSSSVSFFSKILFFFFVLRFGCLYFSHYDHALAFSTTIKEGINLVWYMFSIFILKQI